MHKRLVSLILTIIMLFTMIPSNIVMASENTQTDEHTIYAVNPLYEDVISIDDLKEKMASDDTKADNQQLFRADSGPYFSDYDSAVAYLREQLVDRNTEITLNFPASWFDSYNALYWTLLNDAMKCDDSSTGQEGDALIYGYIGCSVSYSTSGYIQYSMEYYSNAEQEAELTKAVSDAMNELQLDGLTESQKIIKIHDYICDHVDYAYDSSEDKIYTAYGALCTGKAVCQGYAVLFYRMCKEAGLSVRIISGIGNGGPHAWNIVRIGKLYYNVDSTWDGQDEATYHTYLLKSEADFDDHTRQSTKVVGSNYLDYTSDEFNEQYPMSAILG